MRSRILFLVLVLLSILSYNKEMAFAEDPIRQGVLVTTYNQNNTLCKHFYSLYSSFKECPLTDGYCFRFKWDSTDDSAIRKIPLQELAINQYGYTQINVAYPIDKPYAIVYLMGFNGDRNPRLEETWKVNAKELQALTAREPHPLPYDKWILRKPQIEKETYADEFAELLSHSEKISDDWSPVFTVDDVDYVVEIKCVEHFEFGGYNICDQITKMTIKRIAFELKATPVCEFAKPKRK